MNGFERIHGLLGGGFSLGLDNSWVPLSATNPDGAIRAHLGIGPAGP